MKAKLLGSMSKYFGEDKKRIDHARKVLAYAEQIMEQEGGDREVVVAAAILHDIGIQAAEKKYNSTAGKYQQIEGPPIAEEILRQYSFPREKISEVLQIIGHHHSGGIYSINFEILWDADWLVNLPEEIDLKDKVRLKKFVDKIFKTPTGKMMAAEMYL
ncbi:MAG: HD domain-containing protein [Candidatus Margulisbacteria bacterium]|nr:HD domain-containing protein [Candidatus Margulisiibacteriota bacterium]